MRVSWYASTNKFISCFYTQTQKYQVFPSLNNVEMLLNKIFLQEELIGTLI
jgi:hypothetical protein